LSDKKLVSVNPVDLLDHNLNLELFKNLPKKQYDDLKEDIKNRGIQDPLHIRKIEDGFQVICGHQRKLVAIDLKLKSVPCIVRDDLVEEWQVEEQLIRDNLNRRHLSDPEIARVSKHLLVIEKAKSKQRQIRKPKSVVEKLPTQKDKKPKRSRDKVAESFGKSGRQLEKIQYVNKNATGTTKEDWEAGRLTTNRAYESIKNSKQKVEQAEKQVKTEIKSDNKPVFNKVNENIEWAKWSWNPQTGCKHNCSYCYARDIANRFYKQGFKPTFHERRLAAPGNTKILDKDKKVSGINNVFVCSMADLFGDWVPETNIQKVLDVVKKYKEWNYLFLTKNPKRLLEFKFPNNAWVGTTVDYQKRVDSAENSFSKIKAKVKFVSCEPLKEKVVFNDISVFDWLIIGGQSESSKEPAFQPKWDWVESLLFQARKAKVKVYFKPNLSVRPKEYPMEGV